MNQKAYRWLMVGSAVLALAGAVVTVIYFFQPWRSCVYEDTSAGCAMLPGDATVMSAAIFATIVGVGVCVLVRFLAKNRSADSRQQTADSNGALVCAAMSAPIRPESSRPRSATVPRRAHVGARKLRQELAAGFRYMDVRIDVGGRERGENRLVQVATASRSLQRAAPVARSITESSRGRLHVTLSVEFRGVIDDRSVAG